MSDNSGSRHGKRRSNTSRDSSIGKSGRISLGVSMFMGKKNSERRGSQHGSSPSFSPISPASPSNVPPEFLPPKHKSTQTSMPERAHKATQVPSSASTVSSLDTTSTVVEGLRTLPRFGAEDAQSVGSGAATSDIPGIALSEAGRTAHDANIEPGDRSPSVQSERSSLLGSTMRPDGVSSPHSGSTTISGNRDLTSPTASVRSTVPAPSPPRSSHQSSASASRGQPRSPVPAPSPPGSEPGASRDQPRSSAGPDSASRSDTGKGRLITNEVRTSNRTKTRTWELDPETGQIDVTSNSNPDTQKDHKRELEPKRREGEKRRHGHRTRTTSSRRSSTSWEFKAGPNRPMSLTQTESTKNTTEITRSR